MKIQKLFQILLFKESILLIFGLVWLWFSISLYTDSNYTTNDLKSHYGTIESIDSAIVKVIDKPLFKEITKQLKIKLFSDPNNYTIVSTENLGEISSHINVGDTVNIYTKPRFMGIFGLKKANAICHLTKNNNTIVDYSKYKESISGFFYLTGVLSIILIIAYVTKIKKRLWRDFGGYVPEQKTY